jgi:hypothetical protein
MYMVIIRTYPQDVGYSVDIYPCSEYIWGFAFTFGEARHSAWVHRGVALLTQYRAGRCSQVRGIEEGRDSSLSAPVLYFSGGIHAVSLV